MSVERSVPSFMGIFTSIFPRFGSAFDVSPLATDKQLLTIIPIVRKNNFI
jgi:hypothetical protein